MAARADPPLRLKRASAGEAGRADAWPLLIGFAGLAFFPVMAATITLFDLRDPAPADRPGVPETSAPQAAVVVDPPRLEPGLPKLIPPKDPPKASLMSGRHDVLQTLSANPSRDLCLQLASLAFANEGWRESKTGAGGWECLSADSDEKDDAAGNTLFFVLRGEVSTQLGSAFVKINVHVPEDRKAVLGRATDLLSEIGSAFASPLPPSLIEAVLAAKEIEGRIADVSYKFTREFGTIERYNLRLWRRILPSLPQDKDLIRELLSAKL